MVKPSNPKDKEVVKPHDNSAFVLSIICIVVIVMIVYLVAYAAERNAVANSQDSAGNAYTASQQIPKFEPKTYTYSAPTAYAYLRHLNQTNKTG